MIFTAVSTTIVGARAGTDIVGSVMTRAVLEGRAAGSKMALTK
jgi:hypothetical protein